MIIITTPRKIGELGRHLARTGRGSNKVVIIREDLVRDAPVNTTLALRMMAGIARQNRRLKRDIVHIKIAPKVPLTPAALERVLCIIEEEYGIPFDCPRHIVEHVKGDHAPHFHLNYPMMAPGQAKALRFERSRERDEMIARRLEIELGEGLNPSVRVERVADMLRERGHYELAEIAAAGPIAEKGMRRDKAAVQQAARLEADGNQIDARLLAAWRKADGNIFALQKDLETIGFRLAAGDKRVAGRPLVRHVDVETLSTGSLTRDLNRVLKAAGDPTRIREIDLGEAVGELRPEKDVKAELRQEAPARSCADLLGEFDRFVDDMESDGEVEAVLRAKKARVKLAARLTEEERGDLRQRQGLVRERYRKRDRLRRARVNRAFLAAGVFGSPVIRKLAFYVVAAGALATGAGLILALAIAGVTVASLPSYAGAKRLRKSADQAAADDRVITQTALRDEARRFFRDRAIAMRIAAGKKLASERKARVEESLRHRAEQTGRRLRADLARSAAVKAKRQHQMQQGQRIAASHRPKVDDGSQQPLKGNKQVRQRLRSRGVEL